MSDWLGEYLRERMARTVVATGCMDGTSSSADTGSPEPQITIHKYGFVMPVSNELLMDVGAIPDTREHKPVPLRWRFRWWRNRKREDFAVWIYERLSGDKFPDLSDYR